MWRTLLANSIGLSLDTEMLSNCIRTYTYIYIYIHTLSERLLRISGMSCCNLDTRSAIWSSVILELANCLEWDLLLDILRDEGQKQTQMECICIEIVWGRRRETPCQRETQRNVRVTVEGEKRETRRGLIKGRSNVFGAVEGDGFLLRGIHAVDMDGGQGSHAEREEEYIEI